MVAPRRRGRDDDTRGSPADNVVRLGVGLRREANRFPIHVETRGELEPAIAVASALVPVTAYDDGSTATVQRTPESGEWVLVG